MNTKEFASDNLFSTRIQNTPSSFIREILKVTQQKDIISFAGGLPNPISFPSRELEESSHRIIHDFKSQVFQYATTEGHEPLREYIAKRYQDKFHLPVTKDDILITTGSQQALDLIGKVLINKGDAIGIEKPGYLGAIQTFSMYEPTFKEIDLLEHGLDITMLKDTMDKSPLKLLYTVPNFQNPTGLTYGKETRDKLFSLLQNTDTFLIEDDPYGDLRFEGEDLPYIGAGKLPNSILLGSISKIISPGMRLGWICTKHKELMSHLVVAKQASDLHSNIFAQYLIHDYLSHHDLSLHMEQIKQLYRCQSTCMLQAIKDYLPPEISYTKPEGGMFLWLTLPNHLSSLELLSLCTKKKVVFVPGDPFYTNTKNASTLRLNYTNSDESTIREGIRRIAEAYQELTH